MNANQAISVAACVMIFVFFVLIGVMKEKSHDDDGVVFGVGGILGSVLTAGVYGMIMAFFGR